MIYLVDDDARVRKGLGRLIRSFGMEVETFGSAEEFLAARGERPSGVVVVDVTLPGMSGPSLLQRIRRAGSDVRAIVISAVTGPPNERAVSELGISFWLSKPLDPGALLEALRSVTGEPSTRSASELPLGSSQRSARDRTDSRTGLFRLIPGEAAPGAA